MYHSIPSMETIYWNRTSVGMEMTALCLARFTKEPGTNTSSVSFYLLDTSAAWSTYVIPNPVLFDFSTNK